MPLELSPQSRKYSVVKTNYNKLYKYNISTNNSKVKSKETMHKNTMFSLSLFHFRFLRHHSFLDNVTDNDIQKTTIKTTGKHIQQSHFTEAIKNSR